MKNSKLTAGPTVKDLAAGLLGDVRRSVSLEEMRTLVGSLKKELEFGIARKLIQLKRAANLPREDDVWMTQQLALCTCNDEELYPSKRFDEALELLEGIGLQAPEGTDPEGIPPQTLSETLSLGGAVYKRRFEHSGQLENLHRALELYRAAWRRDPKADMGYGGVNAAYVLDLLALRLETAAARADGASGEAGRLRGEAEALRREIAAKLPELVQQREREGAAAGKTVHPSDIRYRFVVTLAEVHLGLGDHAGLARWLDKARAMSGVSEWDRQSTFRQFLQLARAQKHAPPDERRPASEWSEPWKTLARFFDKDAEQAFSSWRGKVGLALSGGGFRASLYHLGVLARLAEMDVLRTVEVLSTVSGGSIVGAHYYLELQKRLTEKKGAAIDYVEIVRKVQQDFLKGVQRNLRTRVMTNLGANLKMLAPDWLGTSKYTRSHRIGELYERELYDCVRGESSAGVPWEMQGLRIQPADEPDHPGFKPKFQNWRRRAKVPVLLLNSTSLNSGHNWQFTATWMGEPPGLMGETVDMNARYRRLYYWQAPREALRNYRLGHAVAASACVPGLFEPLEINYLYPGRTVRLVDGGVHDNQGVAGLLDESCDFILCSDASGQMDDEISPSDGTLGVPLRASSIQGDRVREAQYQDLRARVENQALHGLFFIHLKQELVPSGIDWIQCQDPGSEPPHGTATSYGVDRDLQNKLAAIRTDLDSFTEVEAYALMLSGYRMTERQFEVLNAKHRAENREGWWGGFDPRAPRGDWPFLKLETLMAKPSDSTDLRRRDLGRQLEVGSQAAFKVWRLVSWLRAVALAVVVLAGLAVVRFLEARWEDPIEFGAWTVGGLVIAVGLFAAGLFSPVVQWLNPRKAMRGWLMKGVLAGVGWLVANLHVHAFDPLFLKRGKLDRLMNLPPD